MKILITGGAGMLGRTLARRFRAHELFVLGRDRLDVSDARRVRDVFGELRPDVVIHSAAMTAVDRAEIEEDEALRINAVGSGNVALGAHAVGARVVAISTDYVFSGDLDRPYHEWDATGPRTAYGRSKLAGERAVEVHCPDHLIVRTAWLYGPGGPSFVHTMLRFGRQAGVPLRVVDDQRGNPTSTDALAAHLDLLIDRRAAGTVHLTCEGETSWFGFAQEIFKLARLERPLVSCTTDEYPRPAPRPKSSRLEKRGLRLRGLPEMPDWRRALAEFLEEHPDG